MNKKTLYEFSIKEAENELKNLISERDNCLVEVSILTDTIHPTKSNLKLLEKVRLGSTSGTKTIYKAKETFKSYIDSDFKNWDLDKITKATPETDLYIYELTEDSNFNQMLTDDLDKLVMTQSQIIEFCEKYPTKLVQDAYATFFIIKENNEYFFVSVYVYLDGLGVNANRFLYVNLSRALHQHRIVVPQFIS